VSALLRRGIAGGTLTLLLMALLLLAAPARAQYLFGKNKVIYSPRDWLVSRSERVELFYYPEEEHLARMAIAYADTVAAELEEVFALETCHPVPLVLYGSQHDFRETNVIPSLIPESVGGFTDLIRGRVVVPSTGSLSQLRHVIRHEMVHAYMLEKLSQVMSARRQFSYQHPPLWFVEGLAEFYSVGEPDTEGEMLLREGILEGTLPPLSNMWRIHGTYLMYKMGQSVVAFLDRNYSTDAVRGILESWWRSSDFDRVLEMSLGLDLEELDRRWRTQMRRRYYPAVGTRTPASERGRELLDSAGFQSSPAALSDSSFVYLETESGHVDLARSRLPKARRGRARPEILLAGGRNPETESIPLFRSRLGVGAGLLVLSARSGPRDHLLFLDPDSGATLHRFEADSLVQIESPSVAGDGRVLFSGIDPGGRRDLYLLAGEPSAEEPRWELRRLSVDDFDDRDPAWHPDGERFLFSSDRAFAEASSYRNLYEMELASGQVRRLSRGEWVDQSPVWHADGERYLYVSDRKGAWDVYSVEGSLHRRQTACYGAAQSPSWIGEGFLASVYQDGRYRLFHFELNENGQSFVQPVEAESSVWPRAVPPGDGALPSPVPYERRWGLDFVQSGLAYDPEFGNAGGGQIGFTDLLGNHQLLVALSNNATSAGDFFKRLNVGVSYSNLSRRINWSLALFHLSSDFDPNWEEYRFERRIGGLLGLRYPFNLFRRIELSLTVRGIIQEEDLSYRFRDPEAVLSSIYFSWVHDTVLWGYGGPYDGERLNLTVGYSTDFGQSDYGYSILRLDARKYWRLTRHSVYAARLMGHFSSGDDPRFFHLGGPLQLRGWPYRHFHSKGVWLSNHEIRFPVLHGLRLYTPIGNLDLPSIRGSAYFDAARLSSRFFSIPQPQWAGALGVGLELGFGPPVVIRWNMTRKTDFESIEKDLVHQVFLGWNY